jgi:hypothetical protein
VEGQVTCPRIEKTRAHTAVGARTLASVSFEFEEGGRNPATFSFLNRVRNMSRHYRLGIAKRARQA